MNNLSINIYGENPEENVENLNIVLLYLSQEKSDLPAIHLLMIQNKIIDVYNEDYVDNDRIGINSLIYHFLWIMNLSRLVRECISKYCNHILMCDRCLCHFVKKNSFQMHRRQCKNMSKCRVILPTIDDRVLKLKNYRHKEKVSFVVYADIECLLEPATHTHTSNTTVHQKHVPTSVAYNVQCSYDQSLCEIENYRAKDCIEWFVNQIKSSVGKVDSYLKNVIPIKALTLAEKKEFQLAKICHICEKSFHPGNIKHRDHCHFTGRYRGVAHQSCNINYKDLHIISVIFHNLSGYDLPFLISNLATSFEGRIDLLPINKEKYISFTKHVDNTKVK